MSLGESSAETARQRLELARQQVESAGEARGRTSALDVESRDRRQTVEAELAGLRAESTALTDVLAAGITQGENPTGSPIIDLVTVESGYETRARRGARRRPDRPIGHGRRHGGALGHVARSPDPAAAAAGRQPADAIRVRGAAGAGAPSAPDRRGRRRRDRPRPPTRIAPGPAPGHGRRRSVALGRLHAARRRAERRGDPADPSARA
ncbi:MAG: hypothetical protein WDO24_31130 [Pseudomonadota bacterium]